MIIVDSFTPLQSSHKVRQAHPVFQAWDYSDREIAQWFRRSKNLKTARQYLSAVSSILARVEEVFGTELPGELVLVPSMDEVDGFARYDRGHHSVMLGIDYPGASLDYLTALTAHELSHVYRDHAPEVWGFLKKPLQEVTREEYLEATTWREHLVSEGLATLTSQHIFPTIAQHDHHYYEPEEMDWCQHNVEAINRAIQSCIRDQDPDPWRFYHEEVPGPGAPSRTHYFWSAREIARWIQDTPGMTLLKAHSLPAGQVGHF